jgi:hypothetical protein
MCTNVNLCQQERQVSNQAAEHFLLGAFSCLQLVMEHQVQLIARLFNWTTALFKKIVIH